MPPLAIAVAVVLHDGQALIGRRPLHVPLGGLWEFPGGKVRPQESPAVAAERECLEETGLAVLAGEELLFAAHQYDHGELELRFFACTPLQPEQAPRRPFCWAPIAALADYEFPAANAPLIAALLGRVDPLE